MTRQIAYFVYSGGYSQDCLKICLKSLRKHNSSCDVEVYAYNLQPTEETFLYSPNINAKVTKLKKEEWVGLIQTTKVEKIKSMKLELGDHVLVLDTDLVFRTDPFKVFENEFDVMVTSRYYRHSYVVNGGVWGFRYNNNSSRFLDFHIKQIRQPSWEPYCAWKEVYNHHSLGWQVNQDFLCVMLLQSQMDKYGKILASWCQNKEIIEVLKRSSMPIEINLFDAGPDWNHDSYIGSDKKALFKYFFQAIYFSDIKIIHLKNLLHQAPWPKKLGLCQRSIIFYFQWVYFLTAFLVKQCFKKIIKKRG